MVFSNAPVDPHVYKSCVKNEPLSSLSSRRSQLRIRAESDVTLGFYSSWSSGSAPNSLATYLWFYDLWWSVRENLTRITRLLKWITNIEICLLPLMSSVRKNRLTWKCQAVRSVHLKASYKTILYFHPVCTADEVGIKVSSAPLGLQIHVPLWMEWFWETQSLLNTFLNVSIVRLKSRLFSWDPGKKIQGRTLIERTNLAGRAYSRHHQGSVNTNDFCWKVCSPRSTKLIWQAVSQRDVWVSLPSGKSNKTRPSTAFCF